MLACLIVLLVATTARGEIKLSPLERYTFADVSEAKDLSGVIKLTDDLLLVGSDETIFAETLQRTSATTFAVRERVDLLQEGEIIRDDKGKAVEIDIEGIAKEGNIVYVIGSHSLKRKKVDEDRSSKSQKKNRKRLAEVVAEPSRHHLIQLAFDSATSSLKRIGSKNLHGVMAENPYLKLAATIPSKENGLDIEGIAAKDGKVYVGFRGPVLRENHVPVARFEFDKPKEIKMLFINLGGRGIRDMATVQDGFLIIGGPVGELGSYVLYYWNGMDAIYGKNNTSKVVSLGEIAPPEQAKAEGLAVISETDSTVRIMILYDGIEGGAPEVYELTKTW